MKNEMVNLIKGKCAMGQHSKKTNAKRVVVTTAAVVGTGAMTLGLMAGTAGAFPGQEGIIKCESGGNPAAVNNTAAGQRAGRPAGLFQIVTGTWLANGGGRFAPTADRATAAQQQIVADAIYARSGYAPWACKPSGGSGLGTVKGGAAEPKSAPKVTPKAAKPSPHVESAPPVQPTPRVVKPQAQTPAPAPKLRVAVPVPVATGESVTVNPGDSLWRIAKAELGDGARWPAIYALNKQRIGDNPNLIFPGAQLIMPR